MIQQAETSKRKFDGVNNASRLTSSRNRITYVSAVLQLFTFNVQHLSIMRTSVVDRRSCWLSFESSIHTEWRNGRRPSNFACSTYRTCNISISTSNAPSPPPTARAQCNHQPVKHYPPHHPHHAQHHIKFRKGHKGRVIKGGNVDLNVKSQDQRGNGWGVETIASVMIVVAVYI